MAQQHSLTIQNWHAHIYFESHYAQQAKALCEEAGRMFGIVPERLHSAPIGPHPLGSCPLTLPSDQLGEIIGWLLKRGAFTVLVHGNSGNELFDHTQLAFSLGQVDELRLEVFGSR